MIPEEIAAIMKLIAEDYAEMDDETIREVHLAAQRIWDAGYRVPAPTPIMIFTPE